MDLGAALMAIAVAFGVKLVVMILTARLVVKVYGASFGEAPRRLWILVPKAERAEVRILWLSLVFFAISEATCGVELYVILRSSAWLESIHGVVSAIAMGLFAVGLWDLFDRKSLRYAEPSCALHKICRTCTVQKEEGYKLAPLVSLSGSLVALASVPPLFAPVDRMVADTRRLMLPFPAINAWYDQVAVPWMKSVYPAFDPRGGAYFLPRPMLIIEWRVIPIVAAVIAIVSVVLSRRKQWARAVRWLALAAGMLAYSYFELTVYRVTGDALLGSLFHEVGELWFLVAVAELLVRAFPPAKEGETRLPVIAGG